MKMDVLKVGFIALFLIVSSFTMGIRSVHASTVYAVEYFSTLPNNFTFLSFDTSTPTTQNIINSALPPGTFGGGYSLDFDPTGVTLYAIKSSDEFGTINTTTGVFTQLKTLTGFTVIPEEITGMKIDPSTGVFYVSAGGIVDSTFFSLLYTLDPTTGVLTLIGSENSAPQILEIAISGGGQMYAIDASTDSFYSLNKATGAATLIGPLGFDIIGAQGMDFDYSTNTLYAALSQFSNFDHFSTINLSTGALL